MAKKRPKVSTVGGMSRSEAENIGKRVTNPLPPIAEPQRVVQPEPKTKVLENDPMVIVRVRKSYKQRAKSKASQLDKTLYEYLEMLIDKDLEE